MQKNYNKINCVSNSFVGNSPVLLSENTYFIRHTLYGNFAADYFYAGKR